MKELGTARFVLLLESQQEKLCFTLELAQRSDGELAFSFLVKGLELGTMTMGRERRVCNYISSIPRRKNPSVSETRSMLFHSKTFKGISISSQPSLVFQAKKTY